MAAKFGDISRRVGAALSWRKRELGRAARVALPVVGLGGKVLGIGKQLPVAPTADRGGAEVLRQPKASSAPLKVNAVATTGFDADLGVLFVPEAPYHGIELGAIGSEMQQLGYQCTYLVPPLHADAIVSNLGDHDWALWKPDTDVTDLGRFDAVVAMNDWGPSRQLFHLSRVRRRPSFAKVEGVQDFQDIDTGRIRLPYLAADYVLAQGGNDVKALHRSDVLVVGNASMERVWARGPRSSKRFGSVVINSNFTYGVLLDARDEFLAKAVSAVLQNGLKPIISQHPADRRLTPPFQKYRSDESMSDLLWKADALISRFSTVPFEAMAAGTPFVYFNPHDENVPAFRQESPAFTWAATVDQLRDALDREIGELETYRSRCEEFFRQQIDITDTPSARRSALAIEAVLLAVQP